MLSACVAAVKCRPITLLLSVIVLVLCDHGFCCCLNLKKVPIMSQGASFEWHFSFPLMNSFNKTKAAVVAKQTMLSNDFSFLRL